MPRRTLIRASALAVAVAMTGCGQGATTTAAGGAPVSVSTDTCGHGWRAPRAGKRAIGVLNSTGQPATVSLIGSDQERVVIDPQPIHPHTDRTLRFVLAPGTYAWRCQVGSSTPRTGALFSVHGEGNAFDVVDPPTPAELNDAVDVYRVAVTAGIARLVSDTDALAATVRRGDLAASRDAALTAHLDYLRLGAAYGTFGDHDSAINGTPEGLPGGAADPSFTGFHRLEIGLWGGAPLAAAVPVSDALAAAVGALQADFPNETTPTVDLPLRSHEILENGMQFDLTGQHDFGSQTQLASLRAEVDATNTVLTALTPALQAHAPTVLTTVTQHLTQLATTLDQLRRPDGAWPALGALGTDQRRDLDGVTAATLEQLSHVPVALELLGDGD